MSEEKKNVREPEPEAEQLTNGSAAQSDSDEPLKTVPSVLENKFADFTYKFADLIPQHVKPNTITVIGFIGGFIGALCFYLGSFCKWLMIISILGLITHIVADNLDGYIARTRNLKSPGGGYIDLLSDILVCTFTLIFIGLSPYAHPAVTAFSAPLYGIQSLAFMYNIMYFNEFPFPPIGPFEIHSLFIIIAILNMVLGPCVVFCIGGVGITVVDIILTVGGIGAWIGFIQSSVTLFRRLNGLKK